MVPQSWLAPIKQPIASPKTKIPPQQVEQPVHFEIPQAPPQMPSIPPEQLAQQEAAPEEKKKKNWKKWLIIIAVIIIIAGLGIYFLKG